MSKTKTITLTKSGLTAVFTFTGADELKVTGDTFSRRAIMPTSGTCKITQDRLQEASAYVPLRWADQTGWGIAYYAYNNGAWSTWSSGATKTLTKYNNGSDTGTTSQFFNSNNPTTRRLPITYNSSNGSTWAQTGDYSFDYYSVGTSANFTLGQELVLDVPPTFSNTDISFDTNYVYTGLTTASVDVSELSAKYGGYITKAKLIIGTQTATLTGDATNVLSSGTLSILLNAVGTFTPTIIVTDSRGQTTTKTLADITVNGYVAPSLSFTSIRTDANGVANDEGTFAVLTANINYTDAIAKLIQPTGTIDGTPTTINWYTDRALTSAVDWTDYNPTSPVTLYGFINGGLSTELSYIVGLTPNDNLSSGTEITQTLGGAFYTIDFLAGGHGIAFGQPSTDAGFYCNMDATFQETLTAQDMTAQEVDDFVNSLSVSGEGVAVDQVVEQGTDGIWTYRKWTSGIAECWGKTDVPETTYSANGGYKGITVNLPSGLFSETPSVVEATGLILTDIHTDIGFTSPNDANSVQTYLINRHPSINYTKAGRVFWNVKGRWK